MLTSIEKLALIKALTEKDFKAGVGVHVVDKTVTLHIKGTVSKAKDHDKTPTTSIPLIVTMAVLLHRMGFQREKAKELLVASMTEALKAGDKAEGYIAENVADIEAAIAEVREITDELPKVTVSGATTIKATITEIEEMALVEV